MISHIFGPMPLGYRVLATILTLAVPASCLAADASAWNGDSHAAARLINANTQNGVPGHFRGGIDIRLAPGWKTYWRYPGDSGVPPHFDFANSENVKSVTVAWPAPHRFSDADGNTIGYKDRVVLPLRIEAKDTGRPAVLRLKLDYAICEKLCVPAQAETELKLEPGSADTEAAVAAAEARVPNSVPLNAAQAFAIKRIAREPGSPPRVVVDVAAPSGTPVELFAEGPTPDWALPLPEPADGAANGEQRFVFALDGLPPGGKAEGAELKLTAVAGDRAIETVIRLD